MGRLRSLEISPRRRPARIRAEEIAGREVKEDPPGRGEGITAGDLSRADRSKVPRLTMQEKAVLLNCERPMDMEDWREMTRERKRGTLENEMTYWPVETTPEVVGGKGAKQAVSPKPPPKAPRTYWLDPGVENAAATGKGKYSKGKDGHGKAPKGKDGRGKDSKGKESKGKDAKGQDAKAKYSKGGKTLPKVEEDPEAARGNYSPQTAREQNWEPARYRNEHAYKQWSSPNDWAYLDEAWRETRDPTMEAVAVVEGGQRN